ncbi:hypothetical protein QBC32DRAFT_46737 [Pseudoneurospora amorphoporcata]|uniref:Uncharacterized protein n=1 Tax=Pseudoneurospora amorphoporcata TaxID=241081 RepID=A0AAN6NPS7_9PEZI|nr:hypothetical protein QBC32DRAFT_46737 [Pseudoneurospora amorphoporcata]
MAPFSPEDPYFNLFFTATTSSASAATPSLVRALMYSTSIPMSTMPSSKETVISKSPILSALRTPVGPADSNKTFDSGYFSSFSEVTTLKPSAHRGSISSVNTTSSAATNSTSDANEIRVTTVTTKITTKLDPMQCQFTKPTEEATVEELLARPPLKHSLSHYVKNARDRRLPAVDPEEERKRFQKAKAELLAAKAAFDLKI